jgi:hypothetical protein
MESSKCTTSRTIPTLCTAFWLALQSINRDWGWRFPMAFFVLLLVFQILIVFNNYINSGVLTFRRNL